MNKLTPSLENETDALRETYAALNRNDIEAAVQPFDTQIAWIEPVEYTGGGTFHGRSAVKAHLSRARGNWAEGSCEPERYIVAGDKVIVFVYVQVRLEYETEWRKGGHAVVYTFCNGKATEMRIFDDKKQALEWAGFKHSDENYQLAIGEPDPQVEVMDKYALDLNAFQPIAAFCVGAAQGNCYAHKMF
jgi:uncharacterized protein